MNHTSLVWCYCISLVKYISLAQARYLALHVISVYNIDSTYSNESLKWTPHDHKHDTSYMNIDFILIQSPQTTMFSFIHVHQTLGCGQQQQLKWALIDNMSKLITHLYMGNLINTSQEREILQMRMWENTGAMV